MRKLKGISLFASAGIAEMNLNKCNFNILLANELLEIRAKTHEFWHPKTEMICGSITDESVKAELIKKAKSKKIDFVLATPPCQGVSLIGKNKSNEDMINDPRNFLIFHAFDIIDALEPKIIIIENVARFLKMLFPYKGEFKNIEYIINNKYGNKYSIYTAIYNAADYGVPQNRNRAIVVLTNSNYTYEFPKKQKHITVREAIGHLPSIESGQTTFLKNHYARIHTPQQVLWMQHTPTGHSAFENDIYFPQKQDGTRLKGYMATYKRIEWDKPAPTITMRNDAISSQSNVHPGRKLENGLYSDARVLSLRELFILSSINPDIDIPSFASDSQIRYMIGEAVPPKLLEAVCSQIKEKK